MHENKVVLRSNATLKHLALKHLLETFKYYKCQNNEKICISCLHFFLAERNHRMNPKDGNLRLT